MSKTVFSALDLHPGDIVQYPGRLRCEHGGIRSELQITRVEGRFAYGFSTEPDGWDHDFEYALYPLQIEENGVLLVEAIT